MIFQPWGVFSKGVASLVRMLFTIDNSCSVSFFTAGSWFGENISWSSIEIIPIEIFGKGLHLVHKTGTSFSSITRSEIIKVLDTSILCVILHQAMWDQVEIVKSLWETWSDVKVPVSGTITHQESFKVDIWNIFADL